MSDPEAICPPWISQIIFEWLRRHRITPPPPPPNGDGPIIEKVLISLHVYVMSYGMKNQQLAQQIRKMSQEDMAESLRSLPE
jgi:hypothetical protein